MLFPVRIFSGILPVPAPSYIGTVLQLQSVPAAVPWMLPTLLPEIGKTGKRQDNFLFFLLSHASYILHTYGTSPVRVWYTSCWHHFPEAVIFCFVQMEILHRSHNHPLPQITVSYNNWLEEMLPKIISYYFLFPYIPAGIPPDWHRTDAGKTFLLHLVLNKSDNFHPAGHEYIWNYGYQSKTPVPLSVLLHLYSLL